MGNQPAALPPRAPRSSKPFLIPMIVIGGLMGMLAAYGVLAIVRDHGVKLQPVDLVAATKPAASLAVAATTETQPSPTQSVATPKTDPAPRPADPMPRPKTQEIKVAQAEVPPSAQTSINSAAQDNSTPNRPRRRQATRASEASLKIATDNTSPSSSSVSPAAPPLPPPDESSHEFTTSAATDVAPSLPPPSSPSSEQASQDHAKIAASEASAVIVPLTLKQDVIRVIAIPEQVSADSLLCDVGFSPELTGRPLATGTYDMAVQGLGKRGEYRQELPLHINGAGAAIDIAIRLQNKAAICEIRPKFSLPGVGIKQLTISSGSIMQKSLNRTMNNTLTAQDALPGMHANLDDLKSQLDAAIAHTNDTGSNINDTGSLRIQWRAKAHQLQLAITKQQNKINGAEQLVANKRVLETDIADLDQISQFAEKIAANASLSVRFYSGDETIPATLK